MVEFIFYDNDGTIIQNIDANDNLPDEVSSLEINGQFDGDNISNYKIVTTMLKNSNRKLEEITVVGLSGESPELLSFLVLICNKTSSLDFSQCQLSTNAMSCLMATLLTHDGIRCLKYYCFDARMPADQAKILLEGVASSPCLESFVFSVAQGFDNNEDVGSCLIKALRRNQSLKSIFLLTNSLAGDGPNFFPNLVKASILGPNMKAVSISDTRRRTLRLDVLQYLLCRKDCTLEKLSLLGVVILTGPERRGSIIQNVSVTSLNVTSGGLSDGGEITKILTLFKSLVELDLSENELTQLSFLDPLFVGEKSRLKSLNLSDNRINEEEMKNFVEKLRKMRGLKHLAIAENEWEDSDSASTAVIDALRHNTDLEQVDFMDREHLPLNLNRGGRRVFEGSQPFPTNLLPRVLERASKISYYADSDDWESPTDKTARADVLFWMIHRIAPQL